MAKSVSTGSIGEQIFDHLAKGADRLSLEFLVALTRAIRNQESHVWKLDHEYDDYVDDDLQGAIVHWLQQNCESARSSQCVCVCDVTP